MVKNVNIGLILLDDFKSEYGDFADQGEDLLKKTNPYNSGIHFKFKKFDLINKNELPDISDENFKLDAIYLTGSRKDCYDESIKWIPKLIDFLKMVIKETNIKIIGVCFGHQVLSKLFDLKVVKNEEGWEMGNTLIKINNFEKLDHLITEDFIISEMHQDIVIRDDEILLKNNLICFGETRKCNVQGLYLRNKLLSFQGHPEFDSKFCLGLAEKRWSNCLIDDQLWLDIEDRYNSLNNEGDTKILDSITNFIVTEIV